MLLCSIAICYIPLLVCFPLLFIAIHVYWYAHIQINQYALIYLQFVYTFLLIVIISFHALVCSSALVWPGSKNRYMCHYLVTWYTCYTDYLFVTWHTYYFTMHIVAMEVNLCCIISSNFVGIDIHYICFEDYDLL
jgi:hypothetical protein